MAERGAGELTSAAGGPRDEIEWQFDAPDPDAVEHWLATYHSEAPDGFDISPARRARLSDRYLDTEEELLRRAGYGLRARRTLTDGAPALEATLKSLGGGGAAPVRRAEFTEPLDAEEGGPGLDDGAPSLGGAAGPVGARLRAVTGGRPLRVILEVDTERTTRALRSGGAELAEIAIDRSTLAVPAGPRRRLDRVEVELAVDSGPGTTQGFVHHLADACSLTPSRSSKLEAGLGRSGDASGGTPAARRRAEGGTTPRWPPAIRRRASMGEAAAGALRVPLSALASAEPVAREGSDPEGVHRMRVATRRLQAALSLYAPALDPAAGALRGELRWLRRELGDVRDLDTHLERLGRLQAACDAGAGRAALAPLADLLRRRRDEARRERLLPALDGERYLALLAGIASLAEERSDRSRPEATTRASAALRPTLRRRGRAFVKALRRARRRSSADDRHRARIRAKQLRYALECSGSLYGRPARRTIETLRPLQELLGAERDALLAAGSLTSLAAGPEAGELPEATLRAMSDHAASESRRARELLDELPRASARARRRWRRLRRERLSTRGEG